MPPRRRKRPGTEKRQIDNRGIFNIIVMNTCTPHAMRIVDEYGEGEHPSFEVLYDRLKAARAANQRAPATNVPDLETAKAQSADGYTYYAFISYSHRDEKWAKWIQGALEKYRLPAAVRKEAGKNLPQRIRPVFRDATDLGAGKLADNLRQELEQSRFLIVVCTPNSAKPNAEGRHWVNEEVERFCELGRADHVQPHLLLIGSDWRQVTVPPEYKWQNNQD